MEETQVQELTLLDGKTQENYRVWKKNTPFLYDYVSTNSLLWPSLSIQFFPDLELHKKKTTPPALFEKQDTEPDVFHQRLLLGTFTLGQAVDSVSIVQLPYYRDLNKHLNIDKLNFNAEKEEFECTTVPKKKLTVLQKINHLGDVNKVSYMPQNPDVIASGNNLGDLVVYDRTKHSSYKSTALGEDVDINKPQLRLGSCGEDQQDLFALDWNKQKEGVILSASMGGIVSLYNIQSPYLSENEPLRPEDTFVPHGVGINDVQWTPDHDSIFTIANDNGYITMFDVRADGGPVIDRKVCDQAINSLSINNTNSAFIATGDSTGTACIWDVRSLKNKAPATFSFKTNDDSITQIKWHPKFHNVLGTSSSDKTVKLIDVHKFSTSKLPLFVHGGHMLGVNDFDWSLHEDWMVASVADDNSLHIWKPAHAIIRGLDQLVLLNLSLLLLESDPGVQNRLSLVNNSQLLLQLERFRFQLSGLLGGSEQLLGGVDHVLQLRDTVDSSLDSRDVLVSGFVQQIVDLLDLRVGPLGVQWGDELGTESRESSESSHQNGFIVENNQFTGDTIDGSGSTGGQKACLGQVVVTGHCFDDGAGLLLGFSWGRGRHVTQTNAKMLVGASKKLPHTKAQRQSTDHVQFGELGSLEFHNSSMKADEC